MSENEPRKLTAKRFQNIEEATMDFLRKARNERPIIVKTPRCIGKSTSVNYKFVDPSVTEEEIQKLNKRYRDAINGK